MRIPLVISLFFALIQQVTVQAQAALNVPAGSQLILQSGATVSVNGHVTVANGGVINNAGTITVTRNATAADFTDNNSTPQNYGNGKFVFTGTGGAQNIQGSVFYDLEINNTSGVSMLTDQTVNNHLYLTAGSFLIGAHTLTLNGVVTGTGKLNGSPASNLVIGGTAGTLNFDQASAATRSLDDLTLFSNSASATLGTALDVYGNIKLNNGTLDLAGKSLTLKSNATNTATIDKLNPSGANLQNATNVTAERWIPLRQNIANGGRAYRVLGSIVSTTTSIKANWQNNETNTVIGTNVNANNPFYGTQITGTGGSANGFDVTQSNAPSLYTFTPGSSIGATLGYPAVTNTNINTFDGKTGYFLYLRGDRSMSTQIPYNPAGGMPTSSTTLRATGAVQKGPVSFTISGTVGDFSLITNPYPAPLDWQAVSDANPGISTSYYMWDANMGIRGAFVTVLYSGSNGSGSVAGRYIQPGEAFFVQSNGTAVVNMTEAMKAVGNNNNGIFRQVTPFESFSVDLYLTEANTIRHTADGILVRYANNYSTGIDTDDADEINNWNENIAVTRAGSHLALDSRPVIVNRDTIALFMNNMRQTSYELVFTPSMFTNTGLKAELVDHFLNIRTLLSVIDSSVVPFTVTSDPASADSNRFIVVFGAFGPLAIDVLTISAQAANQQGQAGIRVNWAARTETNMDRYEVERSTDGIQFIKLNTTAAIGNSNVPVNYSWFDANPQPGVNFYRVKAIDKNPAVKYSTIVKVNLGNETSGISLYPNPVTAKLVTIAFTKMDKGIYQLRLINGLGQLVFVQQLLHAGGNATVAVKLASVSAGIYQLEIIKPDNTKIVKGLIVAY